MSGLHNIETTVRNEIKGGYRLKISDLDIGMYIDGFRAIKSTRSESGWWIQPPATHQKESGEYVRCPEFDTKNDYWKELENCCLESIAEYENYPTQESAGSSMSEDDMRDVLEQFGLEEEIS